MQFTSPPLAGRILSEIPAETLPLFHYTDAGGLLGMLQHKKLWMTNIHYQNDTQEHNYAFGLYKEVLKKHFLPDLAIEKVDYRHTQMASLFSFSLSEAPDSLSQWRGYCPNGGYAISFNQEQLNAIIKQENLSIGKCVYNREEQESILIDHVIGVKPEAFTAAKKLREKDPAYRMPSGMNFSDSLLSKERYKRLMRIAPLFKNPKFEEEKEWRLLRNSGDASLDILLPLSTVLSINNNLIPIKIRPRKNILIPYIETSLVLEKDTPIDIHKIIVSPTPHEYLALEACKVLVDTIYPKNSARHGVASSTIPYVNW